jgi:tRNA A-37 threonylcarbamoyl transferase component Bud32
VPDGPPRPTERVLAGRYRLVRTLAVGGMATVWEGYDEVLSRRVAVKVPHPHLAADPAYEARFRREAVAAARLSHPGIVATYDTGRDDTTDPPTSFIVMELVAGRTLRDLVAAGPIEPALAVAIVLQVADALDVAHRAGLIHRDVKPANLLVVDTGGTVPRIKVADFGVARAQDVLDRELTSGEATKEGFVVGTARYLAPEQVAAKALDARTDVYALGCVLHELLVGQPPFVRETDLGTALAHLQDAPPPLPPTVPPALADLVRACLAKDPAGRPPSAAELSGRLQRVAARLGQPGGPATAVVAGVDVPTALLAVPAPTPAPKAAPSGAPGPDRRPVAGTKPTTRPSRSAVPLLVVLALVLTSIVVAAFVLSRVGGTADLIRKPTVTTAPPEDAAIQIREVRSFDPGGDGSENDDQLPRLLDGDDGTRWKSDHYRSARFSNLKPGLGLVLVLQRSASVQEVEISTVTQGYGVEVHLAAGPATRLADWGGAVASHEDVDGSTTLRFPAREAGAVLVWFTSAGPSFELSVGVLAVR